MASWDDVRRIALALPGTTEEVCRDGHRTVRVRDTGYAWERPLGRADLAELGDDAPDGPVLAVRVPDTARRAALITGSPGVFFTTEHFDNHPTVLVRLDAIGVDELAGLLREAHAHRAPLPALRAGPLAHAG